MTDGTVTGRLRARPMITVIMPVYNGARYMDSAVESVINQTFTCWEMVIVDDGSEDDSLRIARGYAARDPRITVCRHEGGRNKGVSATRNLAISKARGTYLATLDCDDLWHPEKLASCVGILRRYPDVAFVYSKAEVIDASGESMAGQASKCTGMKRPPVFGAGKKGRHDNPFPYVMTRPFVVPTSSAVFSRCACSACGNFEETTGDVEDTLLWYQLAEKGIIYFIDAVLVQYRVHDTQWNATVTDPKRLIRRRLLLFTYLLPRVRASNKRRVSFQAVNTGFRNIARGFLCFPENDPLFVMRQLFDVWRSPHLFPDHKWFAALVLVTEILIIPLRVVKQRLIANGVG